MANANIGIRNICNTLVLVSMIIAFIAIIIYYGHQYFLNNSKNSGLTVVGIDFGSSFSGYSILSDGIIDFEEHDKNKVFYSEVILGRDTKYGHKIGNDSHNSRLSLSNNEIYFSQFKKFLDKDNGYENAIIESDIPIGDKARLDEVIRGFLDILIKYVREDLKHLNKDLINTKWIITAPALWNDIGKNYLKKLAHDSLMFNSEIVLEPEAVSLTIFHDTHIKKNYISPGIIYLIVDAGGFTVDISLNKIEDNNNIGQLAQPMSFRLGSNYINEKIIEIIKYVYGKENIFNFTKTYPDKWAKILEQIEEKKNNIDSIESENIKLNIYIDKLICDEKKGTNDKKKDQCNKIYKDTKIAYSKEGIFLPKKIITDIISDLSSKIISIINQYLLGRDLNLVVLTGGFSKSQILREKFKKNFRRKNIKIEFLKAPHESVMRGAAIYGITSNKILYRISPVSILIDNYEYKKENEECEFQELKDENGKLMCLKYIRFINIFEKVKTDSIKEEATNPISEEISIYYTYENELNKEEIHLLDKVEIPYSDLPLKERKIKVNMKYSNYISVTVKDEISKKENSKVIYYPTQKDDDIYEDLDTNGFTSENSNFNGEIDSKSSSNHLTSPSSSSSKSSSTSNSPSPSNSTSTSTSNSPSPSNSPPPSNSFIQDEPPSSSSKYISWEKWLSILFMVIA